MRFALLLLVAVVAAPQEIISSSPPKVIHTVRPQYTKEALAAKREGTVVLEAVVGTDGIPSEIQVIRGLEKGLNEKAIECLKQWRFEPARRHEEAVPEKVQIEVNFRLLESPPPAAKGK